MSENTTILSLPLIQGGQAQKHVTHNEALRRLDALVQPVVADMDLGTPPALPDEGDRHIVAAGAVGAWEGRDGEIAVREDNAWAFLTPARGWRTHVKALGADVVFDGTAWSVPPLAPQDMLGVNTGADATNRLASRADATLLTHDGAGHQLKINKAALADTASLLFQTGFSGRAEMGLAGNDDFSVKVSANGATWNTALRVDAASGRASFPAGVRVPRRHDMSGRYHCYTDNRWVTFQTIFGVASENHLTGAGNAAEPSASWQHMGTAVRAGTVLTGLSGLYRASVSQITAIDLRICFQHGPLDGTWSANAPMQRDTVHTRNALPCGVGWLSLDAAFTPYTVPADGHLLVFMRPVGTFAATESIYTSLGIDMVA